VTGGAAARTLDAHTCGPAQELIAAAIAQRAYRR
jgi:hypothetical protein